MDESQKKVAVRRPICHYLPLYRMEVGNCFPIPPEIIGKNEERYQTVRQAIYRWGYRRGIALSIKRQKDGLFWVERVEGGARRTEEAAAETGRDTVQDSQVPQPGVQEAHPVGAE